MKTLKDYLFEAEQVQQSQATPVETAFHTVLSPEQQQKISQVAVKDEHGNLDASETLVKGAQAFSDGLPDLVAAFERLSAFIDNAMATNSPEWQQLAPEKQETVKKDNVDLKAELIKLKSNIPDLQKQLQPSINQVQNLNPDEKARVNVASTEPIAEDAELTRWLTIAGIK
jgi:hypothetical protein